MSLPAAKETFSIIAIYGRSGLLDDAYVCASIVAGWHKETHQSKGFRVIVRRGFKSAAVADAVVRRDYL